MFRKRRALPLGPRRSPPRSPRARAALGRLRACRPLFSMKNPSAAGGLSRAPGNARALSLSLSLAFALARPWKRSLSLSLSLSLAEMMRETRASSSYLRNATRRLIRGDHSGRSEAASVALRLRSTSLFDNSVEFPLRGGVSVGTRTSFGKRPRACDRAFSYFHGFRYLQRPRVERTGKGTPTSLLRRACLLFEENGTPSGLWNKNWFMNP